MTENFTLTIDEVANKLNMSHWGLRHRIKTRGLHCGIRRGRRLYFSEDVLRSELAHPG